MWRLAASWLSIASACTYVEVPFPARRPSQFAGENGSVQDDGSGYVIARTMELSNLLGRTSYIIETVAAGAHGGRYGYVAPTNIFELIGGLKLKVALEGMNEKGLTISALAMGESIYQKGSPGRKKDVSALDLAAVLLANCDSVSSALSYLESISVVEPWNLPKLLPTGLHWAITDATGRSVVVEYLQGERKVSENHPRVMTNDPNLQWHWRNLNTYVNLNPEYPQQNEFLGVHVDDDIGTVPRAVGHGWNLFGLPGDSSSPSRFVRMFYLRGYATHANAPESLDDAIVLGNALLNNVFIPLGTVAREPRTFVDRLEYTPYAILKSPQDKFMMIRGYRNSQWRKIDLSRLDFSKGLSWPLEDGSLGVQDITDAGSQSPEVIIP